MHDLAPLFIDVFVTLSATTHGKRGIHVHVVAGKVQTDEQLEQHAPPWLRCRQKDQQARGSASVRHHVQHGSELCRLVEFACCCTIESVQEAGNAVEQRAPAWVQRHEVEGDDCEEDTRVTCIKPLVSVSG